MRNLKEEQIRMKGEKKLTEQNDSVLRRLSLPFSFIDDQERVEFTFAPMMTKIISQEKIFKSSSVSVEEKA